LPGAARQYVVVGFAKGPDGMADVGKYLMPLTSIPGKHVEKALRLRCNWITVSLLAGRSDLATAIIRYEDSLRGQTQVNDQYKSFPIPQPRGNGQPGERNGLTESKITGTKQDTENGYPVTSWQKDASTSPGNDVEYALRAGSTEVVVEVRVWGKGQD